MQVRSGLVRVHVWYTVFSFLFASILGLFIRADVNILEVQYKYY